MICYVEIVDAIHTRRLAEIRGGDKAMTNHPNRGRTYWYLSARGFANEYTVGIATTKAAAADYQAAGYDRIDRTRALRELTDKGDNATKIYAGVSVDGDDRYNRFDVAKSLRDATALRREW